MGMLSRKPDADRHGDNPVGFVGRAAATGLAFGFLAFFFVALGLSTSIEQVRPPQDLFLVAVNLMPLAVVTSFVCWAAIRFGRAALDKTMLCLAVAFVVGTGALFLSMGASFELFEDRAYLWAMLIPGVVLIVSNWFFARSGARHIDGRSA
jgi:Kef-type K+ transport system membrane component KefB